MDNWTDGEKYDAYMGRWSRLVAREFVGWMAIAKGGRWLDVGCGTGGLSAAVLEQAGPRAVCGVDTSAEYVGRANMRLGRLFEGRVASATELPFEDSTFGAVVSGLVLNFVEQPERAVAEMKRVARPGAVIAFYLWDYAGEMQMLRRFWEVVVASDKAAAKLDEAVRFPSCALEPMKALLEGLDEIEGREIVVPMKFRDFDDVWQPLLAGQGPAPGYVATLDADGRARLQAALRERLPASSDGSIELTARAWAVKGRYSGTR